MNNLDLEQAKQNKNGAAIQFNLKEEERQFCLSDFVTRRVL
jgi:hypothetical protein